MFYWGQLYHYSKHLFPMSSIQDTFTDQIKEHFLFNNFKKDFFFRIGEYMYLPLHRHDSTDLLIAN